MIKQLILAIIMILLASVAFAGNIESNYFYNESGDNVTGVEMRVFTCDDNAEQCYNIDSDAWSYYNNSGANNYILDVEYPGEMGETAADAVDYVEFFFADGYLPKAFVVENDWGTDETYPYNTEFHKGENCRAPIDSLSMVNNIHANEPLAVSLYIDVDGEYIDVDGDVHSAFTDAGIPPFYEIVTDYPEYIEYYSADTLIVFEVRNSSDDIVHTENITEPIYMDTTFEAEFNWIPTAEGNYTARIYTDVTDDQCGSSTVLETSKEVTVLPDRAEEAYYLLLNNLELENITTIYNSTNSVVDFSYDAVSNEIDENYETTSLPFTANYTLYNSMNNVVRENLIGVGAGNVDGFNVNDSFNVGGLPAGLYELEITGEPFAVSDNSYSQIPSDVISVVFEIQEIPTHSFIFTVLDNYDDSPVVGATINVNGTVGTTGSDGMLELAGFVSGDYVYSVTHPNYASRTGDSQIGNVDTEISLFMTFNNVAPGINLPDDLYVPLGDTDVDFSEYVNDASDADEDLTLSVSGEDVVGVSINGMIVTFTGSAPNDFDDMTFTVTDTHGASDGDSTTLHVANTTCSDALDNDNDGYIDLDDPDCEDYSDEEDTWNGGNTQCSDGEDNDGDGLVDMGDPDCESPRDDTENFANIRGTPYDSKTESLRINSFDIGGDDTMYIRSGQLVQLDLELENDGDYDLEDIVVQVSIDELAVWDRTGTMDIHENEEVNIDMYLDIYDVDPGYYYLKLSMTGKGHENGYSRARWYEVYIE